MPRSILQRSRTPSSAQKLFCSGFSAFTRDRGAPRDVPQEDTAFALHTLL
jgi:hypothetical protein